MKKSFFTQPPIWIILAGMLLSSACETQIPAEPASDENPDVVDATNLEETFEAPGQLLVSPDLTLLDQATIDLMAPVEGETVTALELDTVAGGVIVFPGAAENMVALEVGDIMASGVTDKTPFGLLRKVTDKSVTATGVEVVTEQALLEEAIEEGEFTDSAVLELPPGRAVDVPHGVGRMKVALVPATAEIKIQLNDAVLWDADGDSNTKGDQLIASGDILIKPEYEFHVKISGFSMQKLDFRNKTSIQSTIQIKAEVDFFDIHPKIPIFHHTFDTRTIQAGPLPVVITPRIDVFLGLDGQVSVGVSTGVLHTAEMTIGATWENGNWDLPNDSSSQFDFIAPTVKAESNARVYARPRVELLLFGVIGPYGQVDAYFELDLAPLNDPWWVLYGGIDAEVGVEFKIFKFLKKLTYRERISLYRDVIAQAPVGAGEPPVQQISVVYDLVAAAELAHWTSGVGTLPWAFSDTDPRGFVMHRPNTRMEDGNVYGLALETHPEWVSGGIIEGAFTDILQTGYVIEPQDVFVAVFGFLENAQAGEATFRVMIRPENGPNEWIGEVTDTYDGLLKEMMIPLAPWQGQRADFLLMVDAGVAAGQDWATWVVAQIERSGN